MQRNFTIFVVLWTEYTIQIDKKSRFTFCQPTLNKSVSSIIWKARRKISFRKLDFHFNASLAAVNLAKAACKRLGIAIPYPLASHSYTMLICLNDLFACLGLTQTCKLLTNFSKNSFYLLPEPLRLGEFLTNY